MYVFHRRPRDPSPRNRLRIERLEARTMLAADLLLDINQGRFEGSFGAWSQMEPFGDSIAYFARDAADDVSLWIAKGESDREAIFRRIEGGGGHLTAKGQHLIYYNSEEPGVSNAAPLAAQASLSGFRHATIWQTDAFLTDPIPLTTTRISAAGFLRDMWVGDTSLYAVEDPNWSTDAHTLLGTMGWTGVLQQLGRDRIGVDFHEPTLVGSSLFFTRFDYTSGRELWSSDGSVEGTRMVKDVRAGRGSSLPDNLMAFQDQLFFRANDFQVGAELWMSDGTDDGTTIVSDINPGKEDSRPAHFSEAFGELYFQANDGLHGNELWRTDGTGEGTVLVADVTPGIGDSNPRSITQVGDSLFFVADSEAFGRSLYVMDSESMPPRRLSTFPTAPLEIEPQQLTAAGNQLYFVLDDAVVGRELWVSDGTPAGTHVVVDLNPGGNGSNPVDLTAYSGKLLFFADDGLHGYQLWKTDGTPEGTAIFSTSRTQMTDGSSPIFIAEFDDSAFFTTFDRDTRRRDLWKTDGTSLGTTRLSSVDPYSNSPVCDYTVMRGEMFFSGNDGARGWELWATDGTDRGTRLVRDIATGDSSPLGITRLGDKLLFSAEDADHGRELWVSDGTQEGTTLLKDINAGLTSSQPTSITMLNSESAYFLAIDGLFGRDLWRTDGTPEGTTLVYEVAAGPESSETISNLVNSNGRVYFIRRFEDKNQLWSSDGSATGTRESLLLPPSVSPYQIIPRGDGALFIWATSIDRTSQLWFVDPSLSESRYLADVGSSYRDWGRLAFAFVDARLFFFTRRFDLWSSDGTVVGTQLIEESVMPGLPTDLVAYDGELYFQRRSTEGRMEVWRSDGTSEGTRLVQSVAANAITSHTAGYRFFGLDDTLLLTVDSARHGSEPHVIYLDSHTSFSQATFSVDESGMPAGVPVAMARSGRNDITTTARLTLIDDSATGGETNTDGVDYVNTTLDVTLSAGETSKTIWLDVRQDALVEPDEQFRVRLEIVAGGFAGDVTEAFVTIIDDDRDKPDFNADGRIDAADVDLLVQAIAGGSSPLGFDLDGNATVDTADLDEWLAVAGSVNLPSGKAFRPGDANLDGAVDAGDFEVWQANTFSVAAAWSQGDFNADGFADVADFNIWNENKTSTIVAPLVAGRLPKAPLPHDLHVGDPVIDAVGGTRGRASLHVVARPQVVWQSPDHLQVVGRSPDRPNDSTAGLRELPTRLTIRETYGQTGEQARRPTHNAKRARVAQPSVQTALLGHVVDPLFAQADEYLLGFDHTRLTYPYAGRDFRLTDVYGRVIHEIIA